MTVLDELKKFADRALDQQNNAPAVALPAFIKTIARRQDLIEALALDFLQRRAAMPKGRIEVRAHNVAPHRRRTQAQKNAAKFAMAVTLGIYKTRKIGDRFVGSIAMGEVRRMAFERIEESAFYLQSGIGELVNALLLQKIWQHAKVADMRSLVSEVVPEGALAQYDREAAHEAQMLMPKLMEDHAKNAIQQIEQSASA